MKVLKRVFCLFAVVAVSLCLTACKKSKTAIQTIMENNSYLLEDSKPISKVEVTDSFEGNEIVFFEYPFVVTETTTGSYRFYSFSYQGKGGFFLEREISEPDFNVDFYDDFAYLIIHYGTGETEVFDFYGSEVIAKAAYDYYNISYDPYYGSLDLKIETIRTRIGEDTKTIYYELEFDKKKNVYNRTETLESELVAREYHEGNLYGNIRLDDMESLSYIGLDGYYLEENGDYLFFYDSKGKLVSQISLYEYYPTLTQTYVLCDGKVIVQYIVVVDEEDFDFKVIADYEDVMFIKSIQITMDIKTGKQEIVDFKGDYIYLLDDIENEGLYNHDHVKYIVSSANKVLKGSTIYDDDDEQECIIIFDSKLNIISNEIDEAFMYSPVRFSDTRYGLWSPNGLWIVNDKMEKIVFVDSNSAYSVTGKTMAVYDENIEKWGFIDLNGKIVETFQYDYVDLLNSGEFYAVKENEDGDEGHILTFSKAKLVKDILFIEEEKNAEGTDVLIEREIVYDMFYYEYNFESDTLAFYAFDGELLASFVTEDLESFKCYSIYEEDAYCLIEVLESGNTIPTYAIVK